MKFFLVMLFVVMVASAGCKKGSSSSTYNMGAYIESTVTDENFGATDCYEKSGGGNVITFIGQTGATLSQPYISLNITAAGGSITTTTYIIDGTNNTAAYWPSSSSFEAASSGAIVINSIVPGKTISGTFGFTCSNGIVVANGTFTAKAL